MEDEWKVVESMVAAGVKAVGDWNYGVWWWVM